MVQLIKKTVWICAVIFCITTTAQTNKENTTNFPAEFYLNNDKKVTLNDLNGKVILLDFWYRGCFPCLKATPDLIQLQEEFKDYLVIIGINDIDDKEDVTGYLDYKKTNFFSTYKTNKSITKSLNVTVFPTFLILNQKGELVKTEIGFDKEEIHKTIKSLLKEKP